MAHSLHAGVHHIQLTAYTYSERGVTLYKPETETQAAAELTRAGKQQRTPGHTRA
jgi:hypothetical protein